MSESITSLETLPQITPLIVGLKLGEVRHDEQGRHQAYFGGSGVEQLTPYDQAELRDGAVAIKMFTIDGLTDVDYAEMTITTPASQRTPLELARHIRGLTSSKPKEYIEQTPVQYFFSRRGFIDIPISGRARWLALDPQGNFHEGIYDDSIPDSSNQVAMFGEGWTYAWIVQSSRPFVFGELCSPRFIDQAEDYPLGEEGINELDPSVLTGEFGRKLAEYTLADVSNPFAA